MRLKEAFLYLEGLGTGYEIDLQNWFLHCGGYGNGNNNDNSKARIISLSLVEELLYEKWWYENFGNDILIEFSKYLRDHPDYDSPIDVAHEFGKSSHELILKGVEIEEKQHILFHVYNYTHIKENVPPGSAFLLPFPENRDLQVDIFDRYLEEYPIKIGQNGILWLSVWNQDLLLIQTSSEICNLLGKQAKMNTHYLALSPQDPITIQKPSIIDGTLTPHFYSTCGEDNWGRTRQYSDLKEGALECVAIHKYYKIKLLKIFTQSDTQIDDSGALWEDYLRDRIANLEAQGKDIIIELNNGWYDSNEWWRT